MHPRTDPLGSSRPGIQSRKLKRVAEISRFTVATFGGLAEPRRGGRQSPAAPPRPPRRGVFPGRSSVSCFPRDGAPQAAAARLSAQQRRLRSQQGLRRGRQVPALLRVVVEVAALLSEVPLRSCRWGGGVASAPSVLVCTRAQRLPRRCPRNHGSNARVRMDTAVLANLRRYPDLRARPPVVPPETFMSPMFPAQPKVHFEHEEEKSIL